MNANKLLSMIFFLSLLIYGCDKENDNPSQSNNDVIDTASVTLVSNSKHSIVYQIRNRQIIFKLKSNQENAFIDVDVNQNSIINSNYDRMYGSDGSGICVQYFIDANSWTVCGGAPSNATATKSNNDYTFTIPLSELENSTSSTSISVGFWFWSSLNGYTRYPTNENTFSDLFLINTK